MSETALALVQSITAVEFFKPGASKSILENLKIEVRAQAAKLDISTEEGRRDIASLAFKVAKSKTGLDKAGKELVADQKAAIKRIDAERATVWDELEALQKEVRQPLTDFENAEKDRIAGHEAALASLVEVGNDVERNWQVLPVDEMRARLKTITDSQRDWQEFLARAKATVLQVIGQIKTAIAQREKMDADAAELEALRAAAAKQAQKDRDEQIAREAREAAEALARKREEEQRAAAEAERQRIEDERIQAEARAKQAEAQREQERIAAEQALAAAQEEARLAAEQAERTRIATEEAARQAEARRIEDEARFAKEAQEAAQRHAEQVRLAEEETRAAIAKAKKDAEDAAAQHVANLESLRLKAEGEKRAADAERERMAKEAEDRAKQERLQAIIAERERADAEHRKELAAADARENNRKHAAKINGEVRDALVKATHDLPDPQLALSVDQATAIVTAIANGLIPHTKISY